MIISLAVLLDAALAAQALGALAWAAKCRRAPSTLSTRIKSEAVLDRTISSVSLLLGGGMLSTRDDWSPAGLRLRTLREKLADCGACGRHGPIRHEIGDESCYMNAVLCREDSLVFEDGRLVKADAVTP